MPPLIGSAPPSTAQMGQIKERGGCTPDDQHEKITNVYVGLIVHCIESHLCAPEQTFDFVSNIEANLKAVQDALKLQMTQARGAPSASLSTTMGA